jgi:hypothetical protein
VKRVLPGVSSLWLVYFQTLTFLCDLVIMKVWARMKQDPECATRKFKLPARIGGSATPIPAFSQPPRRVVESEGF